MLYIHSDLTEDTIAQYYFYKHVQYLYYYPVQPFFVVTCMFIWTSVHDMDSLK